MDDRKILELYPLPLARGYRRYLNATEPKERHDLGYFLFEIYLKYVAAAAIAMYLAGKERDHRVNACLKGLLRPSLGEWVRFLRECLEFLSRREEPDPAIRSMAALFKEKTARWLRTLDIYNRMRALRTGEPSAKESASLENLLDELVAFRNRVLGHGAPLDREHYRSFGEVFGPAFGELLDRSPFLTARRLVSFASVQVRDGSRVECTVIELMGNQPVRRQEPHRIPYGQAVPAENVVCLLGEDGAFVVLDPILVAHREDVYILNDAQDSPEYLSYSSGERYRPSDLGGKQGALFERILGYRVDSSRIGRICEEIAVTTGSTGEPVIAEGERRLGDYRLVREIGRGGMGTVFEAFQESLGRRVALKVLPGSFALEPQRLERFRREARATARIHHPNIVPVYEVGEAQGTHFYAMELIDGSPLERVIAEMRERKGGKERKGSSAADPSYIAGAVERAAALAQGLEAAHLQGLVHRDVKPSNILVDRTGRWVLVDFGLVHDVEAERLTRSGEMVGTLACMSPEQISRQKVDARTDVFSLGITLYEVLTLRQPFEGKNDLEVQKAILFDDPIPPRKLNTRINRDLETILLHALEKRPDRRYGSVAELRSDLERFLRHEPIAARSRGAFTRAWSRARRHKGKVAVGLVAGLMLLASVFAWQYWPEKRLVLVNQRRVTSDPGLTTEPSLSPDGKLIAYASDRSGEDHLDIWVQAVDGPDSRRLTTDPADDREPAFSPDGRAIAFRSEREGGGVYVVSPDGGDARLLAPQGHRPRFSPDGQWVAYWTGKRGAGVPEITGQIYIVGAAGGEPRQLQSHFSSARFPIWSPDGRHVLFLGYGTPDPRGPPEASAWDWWVTSIDGAELLRTGVFGQAGRQGLVGGVYDATGIHGWVDAGDRVLFSMRHGDRESLWTIPVSTRTFQVGGAALPLTQGTGQEVQPWAAGGGRLAFASVASNTDIWSLPVSHAEGKVTGRLERLTDNPAPESYPFITPDGTRVAYTSTRSGKQNIWLKDLSSGVETRFTSDEGKQAYPVLDSTGSRLAYAQTGPTSEVRLRSLSEGSARTFWKKKSPWFPVWDWSRGGGEILFADEDAGAVQLWALEVASGNAAAVLRHPGKSLFQGHFDPEGRWIAFNAVSEGGRPRSEVFIAPHRGLSPVGEAEWLPITDGWGWDDKPRWSPDGDVLYFTSDRDGFRCLWKQRLDRQSKRPTGPPEPFHHFHSARRSPMNQGLDVLEMSIARDRIVFNLAEETGNVWLAELEERY
jgi:Tol biopolymer transport system component